MVEMKFLTPKEVFAVAVAIEELREALQRSTMASREESRRRRRGNQWKFPKLKET